MEPLPYERDVPTADPLLASTAPEHHGLSNQAPEQLVHRSIQATPGAPAIRLDPKVVLNDPPAEDQPRRWNRMALISGIFMILSIAVVLISGGGGIFPYLLTFSFLTGLVGLLLSIKHKERGKGIAIAAIAWPVVIIAVVIAALNSAW